MTNPQPRRQGPHRSGAGARARRHPRWAGRWARGLGPVVVTAALVAGFGLAACGGDDDDGADLGSNGAEAGDDLAARGEEVFNSNPCTACHSVDGGSSVGPDLSGIYGTTVELENGETVEVDDAYLRESITDPQAKKVAGYPTAMPEVDLSDDEVDALVAYIRSLG